MSKGELLGLYTGQGLGSVHSRMMCYSCCIILRGITQRTNMILRQLLQAKLFMCSCWHTACCPGLQESYSHLYKNWTPHLPQRAGPHTVQAELCKHWNHAIPKKRTPHCASWAAEEPPKLVGLRERQQAFCGPNVPTVALRWPPGLVPHPTPSSGIFKLTLLIVSRQC